MYNAEHITMVLKMGIWGVIWDKKGIHFFCLASLEETIFEVSGGFLFHFASLTYGRFPAIHALPMPPEAPLCMIRFFFAPFAACLCSPPSAVFISPPDATLLHVKPNGACK